MSDLDGVDTESSGDVDGRSHEVQSQVDAAAAARRLVQQLATRRRLLLRVLRYLVAAEVKHAQRLDVLRSAARAPRQAQRAMHATPALSATVK